MDCQRNLNMSFWHIRNQCSNSKWQWKAFTITSNFIIFGSLLNLPEHYPQLQESRSFQWLGISDLGSVLIVLVMKHSLLMITQAVFQVLININFHHTNNNFRKLNYWKNTWILTSSDSSTNFSKFPLSD